MKRTLVLAREPLGELTTAELAGVAGAALPTQDVRLCLQSEFPGSILTCIELTRTCH